MKMDKSQEKSKLSKPIDFKILILIGVLAAGYHIWMNNDFELYQGEVFAGSDAAYLAAIAACSISAFWVSRRYTGSQVFGRAYLFLGLAYLAWFIGDSIYFTYDFVLGEDPYPSPGDALFLIFYGFAIAHIVLNTKYFKRKWSTLDKAWLIGLPIVVVGIYTFVAYETWGVYEELAFDLFYGIIFVLGASILVAFASFGASVFRHSVLGTVWLLLAIGIFIGSVADVWYYYDEIFQEEFAAHPSSTVWMISWLVVIYALYKHRQAI